MGELPGGPRANKCAILLHETQDCASIEEPWVHCSQSTGPDEHFVFWCGSIVKNGIKRQDWREHAVYLRAFPEYPLAPSDRACGNIGKDPNHQRNECLDLHHKALVTEMEGIITSPDEAMDMDAWVEYIQHTLLRILEVHVPSRLILQVVAPIVPLSLQPTAASALHLLRSSLCSKLVGPAMAAQANRKILAEISEVPVKMCAEQDLNLNIRRDLIALLEERQCVG